MALQEQAKRKRFRIFFFYVLLSSLFWPASNGKIRKQWYLFFLLIFSRFKRTQLEFFASEEDWESFFLAMVLIDVTPNLGFSWWSWQKLGWTNKVKSISATRKLTGQFFMLLNKLCDLNEKKNHLQCDLGSFSQSRPCGRGIENLYGSW